MSISTLTRAGRALELIAARHAGKLPADVVAEVISAALEVQKTLASEGVAIAYGESIGASSAQALRQNSKGTPIHVRQNSLGCINDLPAPAVPAERKGRKKQSR
jgi:hypothetical protein